MLGHPTSFRLLHRFTTSSPTGVARSVRLSLTVAVDISHVIDGASAAIPPPCSASKSPSADDLFSRRGRPLPSISECWRGSGSRRTRPSVTWEMSTTTVTTASPRYSFPVTDTGCLAQASRVQGGLPLPSANCGKRSHARVQMARVVSPWARARVPLTGPGASPASRFPLCVGAVRVNMLGKTPVFHPFL